MHPIRRCWCKSGQYMSLRGRSPKKKEDKGEEQTQIQPQTLKSTSNSFNIQWKTHNLLWTAVTSSLKDAGLFWTIISDPRRVARSTAYQNETSLEIYKKRTRQNVCTQFYRQISSFKALNQLSKFTVQNLDF